jgi:hypothetical protein
MFFVRASAVIWMTFVCRDLFFNLCTNSIYWLIKRKWCLTWIRCDRWWCRRTFVTCGFDDCERERSLNLFVDFWCLCFFMRVSSNQTRGPVWKLIQFFL